MRGNIIFRRWGQWASFTLGVFCLGDGASDGAVGEVVAGCALMATGIGLRAIAIWREAQH